MRKKHIILVGIPSSGKSTLGKMAAEALGLNFVDIDIAAVELMDEFLNDNPLRLMMPSGQDEFLRAQRDAVRNLPMLEASIVATGAETPIAQDVLSALEAVGEIIHIKRQPQMAVESIQRDIQLVNVNTGEVVNTREMAVESYSKFIPYYDEIADAIMPNDGTAEEGLRALLSIIDALQSRDRPSIVAAPATP
jgi:shikimate kinase